MLNENNKLVGFVSYLEIIEKFIGDQTTFLAARSVISDILNLTPERDIDTLNTQETLGVARLKMDTKGYRSLPVVTLNENNLDGNDSKEYILEGFVDDIRIKSFSYKAFANALGDLSIEDVMTPVDRLCLAESTGSLKDFIKNFYESIEGELPSSTFVVCDKSIADESVFVLKGILSYVDLLKAWENWFTSLPKKHLASLNPKNNGVR